MSWLMQLVETEIHVNGVQLEEVNIFKYLEAILTKDSNKTWIWTDLARLAYCPPKQGKCHVSHWVCPSYFWPLTDQYRQLVQVKGQMMMMIMNYFSFYLMFVSHLWLNFDACHQLAWNFKFWFTWKQSGDRHIMKGVSIFESQDNLCLEAK